MLIFKGPASFTGEDVAEFHGHGGTVVTNLVLESLSLLGLVWPGQESFRSALFSMTNWTSLKLRDWLI